MRRALPLLLALLAASCDARSSPEIERIEMRQSGWSAINVEINSDGQGRYRVTDRPHVRENSFVISPEQFAALVKRLEPFHRQSVPMTEDSIAQVLEFRCPAGVPYVTDQGSFWVRWVAAGQDRHYSADFGCDHERNRAMNSELRTILRELPIPPLT